MTELIAALIGVVAGALSTGAVQTWQRRADRQLAAKVAARLIVGDLFIAEHTLGRIIEASRWPDHNMPTFERELSVWHDNRQAFAATADATDWTVVAGAYQDLVDLPEVARTRGPLTSEEQRVLDAVRKRIDEASTVAAEHAAPKRERARVVKELGTHNAS